MFFRAAASGASCSGRRLASSLSATEAYATLGLRPTATTDEVKKAYHLLAKQHHPDVGSSGDAEVFKRITSAYSQALLDSARDRSGSSDRSATGGGARYGPGRRRQDGWEEYKRPRSRTSSDYFDHREWDAAHYGSDRDAKQSAYVRELHRHARGGGGFSSSAGASGSRSRRRADSGSGDATPKSFTHIFLSFASLWAVYHLLYATNFGTLREEHLILEENRIASTRRAPR